MRVSGKALSVGVACALLAGAAPSQAHHSFAMFDQAKSVTLQGSVRDFIWSNPHVFIQLMTPNDKGLQEEWSIEMSSPEHLVRAGWKHGSLKPGDKVTITIHPTRDGVKGGQYVSGKGPNGRLG